MMEEGSVAADVLVQFSAVQLSWKSNHGISIWVLQDLDTQE
jgi:DNA-binding FrmR family transcriptional regulator